MISPRLKVTINPEMLPAIDRIGTGEQYAAKSGRRAVTRNQTSAARLIAAAIVLCAAGVSSAQQPYPAKPIRIISPYAPGGTTDVLARLVGSKLTESWGQPILVEPRPGGNTVIGSEIVTKSAPDGYTLLSVLVSHVIVPNLMATPYDAVKDFAALGTIATTQLILVVHPSLPAKSVQELIALARSKPGVLNYGSGGSGTVTHLAGEFFGMQAGIKTQHVPYKGSSQVLVDLVGGQIHMYFGPPLMVLPHVKNGRVRALATSGDARLATLPDLPTATQAGVKGFELTTWYGLLAPAATPRAIIDRWGADMAKVLAMPDVREKLLSQGMDPFISTPDEFAALIKADHAKFARIIKTGNIKLEQ
jgi:tripartite-type tricarboxylate transporter receptor subunit TctC